MTDDAERVRMLLAEAGYPNAAVEYDDDEAGLLVRTRIMRADGTWERLIPDDVVDRAFDLLRLSVPFDVSGRLGQPQKSSTWPRQIRRWPL